MASISQLVAQFRQNPQNVRFADLVKVCDHYFGEPRQQGSSHCVYKTPWAGDPRVNIQNKNGKAKPYQVKQILSAIEKLEAQSDD
ncbi:MAG: toxin HicA [Snowella sp.]|nr:toxin HicA [Snowella sp.]